MNLELAVDILRQTLIVCLMVMMPLMVAAIVIGVAISLLQSITSIQEQTLSFVPKLVGVCVVAIVFANWMMIQMMEFAVNMIEQIPQMVK